MLREEGIIKQEISTYYEAFFLKRSKILHWLLAMTDEENLKKLLKSTLSDADFVFERHFHSDLAIFVRLSK